MTYCGVVRVSDAYDQYRAACSDPLPYDGFMALLADEASFGQSEFEPWEFEGEAYLMHYTLSPEFVAEQAVQSRRSELLEQFEQAESADAFLLAAREQITASINFYFRQKKIQENSRNKYKKKWAFALLHT